MIFEMRLLWSSAMSDVGWAVPTNSYMTETAVGTAHPTNHESKNQPNEPILK
jgi:hypothetical protein